MITKDMTIAEIVAINRNIIVILLNAGMHCVGCPSAQGETLEEACMVHGLDVEPLLKQINAYLGA
jgi:hybrid cluster-associated redox disulfide protein